MLALGSEQDVAFDGGPRKWVLFKEGHFTESMFLLFVRLVVECIIVYFLILFYCFMHLTGCIFPKSKHFCES